MRILFLTPGSGDQFYCENCLRDKAVLTALRRADVRPADGADGIRRQIEQIAAPLIREHQVKAVGFGFGGPVDAAAGRIVKSHHVAGWDGFPLADWCRETLGVPAGVANDADMAGLGEARFGAGRARPDRRGRGQSR